MEYRRFDRIIGGLVFLYALVLFSLTVAPTVSFWDPGERIAVSYGLQVPHPPGAPFYMLVGRLFSMFVPTDLVALSVAMISVISSAVTVLLTFLIVIRLVREMRGPRQNWSALEHIGAYAGGIIGGLTLAASDSFWFDAVEAETYAFSTMFTALAVWLTLRWSEQARAQDATLSKGMQHAFGSTAERWLLIIAYLYGLAIGIHLLSLLSIFFAALIVYFQHFENPDWTRGRRFQGLVIAALVSSAVFLLIFPGLVRVLPSIARDSGAPVLFFLGVAVVLGYGLYYTQKRGYRVANLLLLGITLVIVGYSTYALIYIRSAANPPIDQNDPETIEALISYLGREQYGQTPLFRGPTYDNRLGRIDFQNEVLFPRRYSSDPNHMRVYERYNSDAAFFLKYQIGHMYLRYFLWNFMGRSSDVQDSPAITGFKFIDSRIEQQPVLQQTPSEKASRNRYFALPLILGLIGAGFHASRDWRRAFAVATLFFMTGIGIVLYLNQTPLQPRERDYSYAGSFFAFSLWVGLGATGVIELITDALRKSIQNPRSLNQIAAGIGVVLFLAVPVWMMLENYDDHDRSGNYVAREYALNMLESVDENAILFTNGDNDTFPLWYLQEVEGIRRDVRVANLSLLNTPWYVNQLKNQAARDSDPLPISMPDARIQDLNVAQWQPREIEIPVDPQLLSEDGLLAALEDSSRVESPMRWVYTGRPYSEQFNIVYAADQVVLDIVSTNAARGWERPIYFAVTVSPDGQIGLEDYFQLEGQAFRVVPIRYEAPLGRVVPGLTDEKIKQFAFTNLDNPDVYFDENIRRMVDNYRNVFSHTAQQLAEQGHTDRALAVLDTLVTRIPFETIPGDERSYILLARAYEAAGNRDAVTEMMRRAEPRVLHRLTTAQTPREMDFAAQYVSMIRYAYMQAGDFEAASEFSARIADLLGDSTYVQSPEEIRQWYQRETQYLEDIDEEETSSEN